ncbi:hypothetical protein ID810_01610 [Actinomyces respiraculi]|uniref:Uncharacterized protein n=2 Tax=Actinomycetaceae TaxID=2049 RepID=A0A7T0LKZ3_9ACTO|nr:hypothetical protein ID810_01610 [Actinomyces respiraculi]
MKMETLPVSTAVEWVTAWTGLAWPVSWETAFAIRDRLGWVPYSEDGRLFATFLSAVGADGWMEPNRDGYFDAVDFPLATVITEVFVEPDTASVTWAAYESYLEALTGVFGAAWTVERDMGTDNEDRQAKWCLPNGSSLRLGARSGNIEVYVRSPDHLR